MHSYIIFNQIIRQIINNIQSVKKIIANRNNLIISFLTDDSGLEILSNSFDSLLDGLAEKACEKSVFSLSPNCSNEGLTELVGTQSAGKSVAYRQAGYSFLGVIRRISTVVISNKKKV